MRALRGGRQVRHLTDPPSRQSNIYAPLSEHGTVKEDTLDPQLPKPSLWLINFNTFAMNVEYSCLMPTVHHYTEFLGGDAMFYGLLLSAFSIVRMIVFIPIGWWADERPFREVFSVTAAVGMVGCFIYGAAGALGDKVSTAIHTSTQDPSSF